MRWGLWAALASGPAAVVLWWLAGFAPGAVEAWYSRGLYPLVMGPWSRLWGLVPFPVTLVVLGLLVGAGIAVWFFFPPLKALALGGAALSVLGAWFLLGWGLNVQRPSWGDLHGLAAPGGTVAQLEGLAQRLAARASALRDEVEGRPRLDPAGTARAVDGAWARWSAVEPLVGGRWAQAKAFPWPGVLSTLGIGGIFPPFFGEPLVNYGPPAWNSAFTAAHETAHLRGFCREDEANFLAFAVLRDDPDPRLALAAWSSALLYTASALGEAGPEGAAAWDRVRPSVDPRIFADWNATWDYWKAFQGPVQDAAQAVNDAYLKSQGQSQGVRSYGRMVDLLLASETAAAPPPR